MVVLGVVGDDGEGIYLIDDHPPPLADLRLA